MSTQRVNRTSRWYNPFALPGFIGSPNGGQVFYVNSNGVQDDTTADIASMLFTTLAGATAACRANRGDYIYVMPGHVESVTATSPVFAAGTTIVGYGNGNDRGTFNWTAAASAWTISAANVTISNLNLNFAATAATTVTKAITTSGAKTVLDGCLMTFGAAGGTQLCTTGIEFTTGADKSVVNNCRGYAPTDAAVVNPFKLTNAVDQFEMYDCNFDIGLSTTGGSVVVMTVAPTNVKISGNSFRNGIASSTTCLVGIASATGCVEYNQGYITSATGGATCFGTLGSLQLAQNFGCAGGAKTGILIGTPSS
jgi:hypothetical protein